MCAKVLLFEIVLKVFDFVPVWSRFLSGPCLTGSVQIAELEEAVRDSSARAADLQSRMAELRLEMEEEVNEVCTHHNTSYVAYPISRIVSLFLPLPNPPNASTPLLLSFLREYVIDVTVCHKYSEMYRLFFRNQSP